MVLEAHHMPANAYTQLPRDAGPAIQMLPEHHWETASNPKNTRGARYDVQIELLAQGEFMKAFNLDLSDAMEAVDYAGGNEAEYAIAIAQVEAYAKCLERTGIVR